MSPAAGPPDRPFPLPEPAVAIKPGDRVAVTGAGGFIGSAITRRLLEHGASVVAVTEPGDKPGEEHPNLRGLDVEVRPADVRDLESVRRALSGCRFVFHTAARYGFWARDPSVFYRINVDGTRNVLDAGSAEGVERIVYTSTVGTLNLEGAARGVPATEESVAEVSHLFGHYKRSKYVAEHEVLRAAAEGVPVCLVLPTFPLGPGDHRPTPTGKVVVDFLNGRLPGYVDTAMNVTHVDDVASGHLLALERGAPGRSYIMGGENLSMRDLLALLTEVTGLKSVRLRVPKAIALAAGLVSETVEGRILRREPAVPLEAARMSTTTMIFDDSRARRELGYASRSAREAVEDSVRWFFDNGYVQRRRTRAVSLVSDLQRLGETRSRTRRIRSPRYSSAQHTSR